MVQAPLQKYALVLREKAVQRRAMQSSDELSVPRKASLIDGASDSEEEEEAPMKQSEREDDAQEADEVSSLRLPFSCALAFANSGVSQKDIRLFGQRLVSASCMPSCPLLGSEPCCKTATHVTSRCRDAFAL